jgi:hypothetical protein
MLNKRMLSDWFSAALQTSHKCGRYKSKGSGMKYSLIILLALFSANVFSATANCSGYITRLSYHTPDSLYIKVADAGITKVCSFNEQFFQTSGEGCDALASMATAAHAQKKSVFMIVDNAPTTLCSSITDWSNSNVRFFEVGND